MSSVRVRFAPSPTGPLHIGGVRTALFNYLFAKKHNGTFILRIEDTDQNRYVAGAEQYIKDALEWCGFPYEEGPGKEGDFGPYRQSERKHLYKEYADKLIADGNAYYAFDSAESLNELRAACEAEKKTFIYNWQNRLELDNSLVLSKEEVDNRIARGDKYVIRFKMDMVKNGDDNIISCPDIIRGIVSFKKEIMDDKILFKSDGMPTYHLANIVDDHLMKITHVIRGEEWLSSLPLHVSLYQAFDWDLPKFAHLPLILKPTGKGKLSKRDGDKGGFPVFPLEWKTEESVSRGFKEDGYLPEAVVNFLAFLGWNPGTEQEIFSLEELVEAFDLKRVNKAGAKFDPEKAKWFNQQYFVNQNDVTIAKEFENIIASKVKQSFSEEYTTKVVSLVKERATFVNDLWDLSAFFFEAPTEYDAKAFKKAIKEDTPALLEELIVLVNGVTDFSVATLQDTIKGWITSREIGFGKVMQPLRLSLVGAMKGPDVFEIMSLLGKEESVNRLQTIINK